MDIIGNMRKNSLLPIDELNMLYDYLDENILSITPGSQDADTLFDSILDILIMAYVFGCDSANQDLDTDIASDPDKMYESINKRIADKTWEERVAEYIAGEDATSIKRVIDTETHRVYNEGQYDTAKASGVNAKKTWVTMLDEKVRDTHTFLEGVTVGIDEKFYSISGASAMHPGGFGVADEDVNCRCELRLSK